jgi:hypothetical protein
MGLTDRRALTGGRELAARRTAPGFVSTGRAGPDHCLPDPWIPTCSPARSRPVRDRRTRAPQRLKGLLPRKSMQASCTARSLLGVCTPLGQVGCASGGVAVLKSALPQFARNHRPKCAKCGLLRGWQKRRGATLFGEGVGCETTLCGGGGRVSRLRRRISTGEAVCSRAWPERSKVATPRRRAWSGRRPG